MKIRAGQVKLVTLSLLLFCMCLSANLAYGMGGGGHNGDGRSNFAGPTDASTGNSGTPDVRQDRAGVLGVVALTFSACGLLVTRSRCRNL